HSHTHSSPLLSSLKLNQNFEIERSHRSPQSHSHRINGFNRCSLTAPQHRVVVIVELALSVFASVTSPIVAVARLPSRH
ncbi:hypothetical protein S245_063625, partial [Arachis hypogaea]